MTPLNMPSTNLLLGPNKDDNRQIVKDNAGKLPVTKDEDGVMHSFWLPTETDIANILAGMPIRLSVMSIGHPPVALTVTDQA